METIVNGVIIFLGAIEFAVFVFAMVLLVQLRNQLLDRAKADVTVVNGLIDKNGRMRAELDDIDTKVLRLMKKQREDLQLVDSKDSYFEMDKLLKELISKKDKEIEQFYHD
jgi:hypothetical protein